MSKNKNPAEMSEQDLKMWKDLGLDDFDGGFDDFTFDSDFQENKESRSPTLKLASSVGGSLYKVGKSVLGGGAKHIANKVMHSLPETEAILDTSKSFMNDLHTLKEETRESARPFMNTMARVGKKMLGQVGNNIPTSIEQKLQAKLDELAEATEEYKGLDEKEEKRLAREKLSAQILAEVFSAQTKERIEDKKTAAVKEVIESKITTARFNKNIEVLDEIRNNSYFQTSFLRNTMTAYMKKDLELKYKQFYLAEDTLGTLVNMAKMQEERLDAIIHNSSLPDSQKIYLTELIKKQMKEKTVNGISTKISDVISTISKNILNRTIKPFLASTTEALNMLGMASDLTGMMPGSGGGKDAIIGGGMDLIASHEGGRIWEKVKKRVGDHEFKDIDDAGRLLRRATKLQLRNIYNGRDSIINKIPGIGDVLADVLRENMPDVYNRRSVISTKDLNQYNDAGNLTNRTIETIEDIIPGYLSQMTAHLETLATGRVAEEKVWDAQKKDFVTVSSATSKIAKAMFGDKTSQNLTALQSIGKLKRMSTKADYEYKGALDRRFSEDNVLQKNVYLLAYNLANSTEFKEITKNEIAALSCIANMDYDSGGAGVDREFVIRFAGDAFGYNIHDDAKVQTASFLYSVFTYADGGINNSTVGEFNDLIDELAEQSASGRESAALYNNLGFGRLLNRFGTRDVKGNLNLGGEKSLRWVNKHVNAKNIGKVTDDIDDIYIRKLDYDNRESDYSTNDPRNNKYLVRRDSLTAEEIRKIEIENERIRKKWEREDERSTIGLSGKGGVGEVLRHPIKSALGVKNLFEDTMTDLFTGVLKNIANAHTNAKAFGVDKSSRAAAAKSVLGDARGRTLFGIDTSDEYAFNVLSSSGIDSGAIDEFRNRMLTSNPELRFLRAIDNDTWKAIKEEVDITNKHIKDMESSGIKGDALASMRRESDERITKMIDTCISLYEHRVAAGSTALSNVKNKGVRDDTSWLGQQLNDDVNQFRKRRHDDLMSADIDDGFTTDTGITQNSPMESVAMQQLNSMLRIENILRAWQHLPQIPGVPGFTTGSNLSYSSIARTVGGQNAPPAGTGEALTVNKKREEVSNTKVEKKKDEAVANVEDTFGDIGEDGVKAKHSISNYWKRALSLLPGKRFHKYKLDLNTGKADAEHRKLFRSLRDAEYNKASLKDGNVGYRRPIDGSDNEGNYVADREDMPLRVDDTDGSLAVPVLKNDKIYYINERLVGLLIDQKLMMRFDPEEQVIVGDNNLKHLFNIVPGFKIWGGGDNVWRFRKNLGFNIDESGKPEYTVYTRGYIALCTRGIAEAEDRIAQEKEGRIGVVKRAVSKKINKWKGGVQDWIKSKYTREPTPFEEAELEDAKLYLTPRDENNVPIKDRETGKILEPFWDSKTGHNLCYVKWSDGQYHLESVSEVFKVLKTLKDRNGNKYENIEDAWIDYQWYKEHDAEINSFHKGRSNYVNSRTNFMQRMFKTKGARQAEAEFNRQAEEQRQHIMRSEKQRDERNEADRLVRKFLENDLTDEERSEHAEELAALEKFVKDSKKDKSWYNTDKGVILLRQKLLGTRAARRKEIEDKHRATDDTANSMIGTASSSMEVEKRVGEAAKDILKRLQEVDNDRTLSIEEREDMLQEIISDWNNNEDLANMDGATRARILRKLSKVRDDVSSEIEKINADSSLSANDKRQQISDLLQSRAEGSNADAYGAMVSMLENRFGSSFNSDDFNITHKALSTTDTALLDTVDINNHQLEVLNAINENVGTIIGIIDGGAGGKRRRGVKPASVAKPNTANASKTQNDNDPTSGLDTTEEKKNKIVEEFVNANSHGSDEYADALWDACLRAEGWNDPKQMTNSFIEKFNNDEEFRRRFEAYAVKSGWLKAADVEGSVTFDREKELEAERRKKEFLARTNTETKFDTAKALESGWTGTMNKFKSFWKGDVADTAEHVGSVKKGFVNFGRHVGDWTEDHLGGFRLDDAVGRTTQNLGKVAGAAGDILHKISDIINEEPEQFNGENYQPDKGFGSGTGYYGEITPDKFGQSEAEHSRYEQDNVFNHLARGGVIIDSKDRLRRYGGIVSEPTNIAGGRIQVGEAGAESVIPHRNNRRFKDLIINAVQDTLGEDKAIAVANALSEDAPIKRMAQGGVFGKQAKKQFDKLKGQEAILKEILNVLDESKGYMANMDTSLSGAFGTAVDATGKAITHGAKAMGGLANGIMTTGGRAISGLGGLLNHIPIIGGLLGGLTNLGGKAVSGAGSLMKLPWNLISGAGRAVSGVAGAAGGLLSGVTKLGAGLVGNGLKLGGNILATLSKTGFGIMGLALKPLAFVFGGLFGGIGEKLDKIINLMSDAPRKGSYEDFKSRKDKDKKDKESKNKEDKESKSLLGKLFGGLGGLFGFGKKDKDKGDSDKSGGIIEDAANAAIIADSSKGLLGKLKSFGGKLFKPLTWLAGKTGLSRLGKSVGGKVIGSIARKIALGAVTFGVGTALDIGGTFAAGLMNDRDSPKEMTWKQAIYKAYGCANNYENDFAIKDLQRDVWEQVQATGGKIDPSWVQSRVEKFGYAIEFFNKKADSQNFFSEAATGWSRPDKESRKKYLELWFNKRFLPVFTRWAEVVLAYNTAADAKLDVTGYPDVNLISNELTPEAIADFNKKVESVISTTDRMGIKLSENAYSEWKGKEDSKEKERRSKLTKEEKYLEDMKKRDLTNSNKYNFGWKDEWETAKARFSEGVSLWKEGKYAQSILKHLSGVGNTIKTGVKAIFSGITSVGVSFVNAFDGKVNENTKTWLEIKRKLYGLADNHQLKYGKLDKIDEAIDELEVLERKIVDNERAPLDKQELSKYAAALLDVKKIIKMKDYFKSQYNLDVTENLVIQYFYTWYEHIFSPIYGGYLVLLRQLGGVSKGDTPYPDDIPEEQRAAALEQFEVEGSKFRTNNSNIDLSVDGFVRWVENGSNRVKLSDTSKVTEKNRETVSSVWDKNMTGAGADWDQAKTKLQHADTFGEGLWDASKAAVKAVDGAASTAGSWAGSVISEIGWIRHLTGDHTSAEIVFNHRFALYGIPKLDEKLYSTVEDLEDSLREYEEGKARGDTLRVYAKLFALTDELKLTKNGYWFYAKESTANLKAVEANNRVDNKTIAFTGLFSQEILGRNNTNKDKESIEQKARRDYAIFWLENKFRPICLEFTNVIRKATDTGPNDTFNINNIKYGDAFDPQEKVNICREWYRKFEEAVKAYGNIKILLSEEGFKEYIKGKAEFESKGIDGKDLSASAKMYRDLLKQQRTADAETAIRNVQDAFDNNEELSGNSELVDSLKSLNNTDEDIKNFKAQHLNDVDDMILSLGGRLENGTQLHGADLLFKVFCDVWGISSVNSNAYKNNASDIKSLMDNMTRYLWRAKFPEMKDQSNEQLTNIMRDRVYAFLIRVGCIDENTTPITAFETHWNKYYCTWFVRRVLTTFFYFASLYYQQTNTEAGSFIDITKLSTIKGADVDDVILYFSKKARDMTVKYVTYIPTKEGYEAYCKRKNDLTPEQLKQQREEEERKQAEFEAENKKWDDAYKRSMSKNKAKAGGKIDVTPTTSSNKSRQELSLEEQFRRDMEALSGQQPGQTPTQFANGGIVENIGGILTQPTSILGGAGIAGEAGPEAIIPLTRPNRARSLLERVSGMVDGGSRDFGNFTSSLKKYLKSGGSVNNLFNRTNISDMTTENVLRSLLTTQLYGLTAMIHGIDAARGVTNDKSSNSTGGLPSIVNSVIEATNAGRLGIGGSSNGGSGGGNVVTDFLKNTYNGVRDNLSKWGINLPELGSTMERNAEKIWNFLTKRGWTEEAVAGLLGNLQAESGIESNRKQGDMSPNRELSIKYTRAVDADGTKFFNPHSVGYGLAQWTLKGRKQELLKFAQQKKVSIGDLDMQIEFIYREFTDGMKGTKGAWTNTATCMAIKSSTDISEVTRKILDIYENPADKGEKQQATRIKYAFSWYKKFTKKTDHQIIDEQFNENPEIRALDKAAAKVNENNEQTQSETDNSNIETVTNTGSSGGTSPASAPAASGSNTGNAGGATEKTLRDSLAVLTDIRSIIKGIASNTPQPDTTTVTNNNNEHVRNNIDTEAITKAILAGFEKIADKLDQQNVSNLNARNTPRSTRNIDTGLDLEKDTGTVTA